MYTSGCLCERYPDMMGMRASNLRGDPPGSCVAPGGIKEKEEVYCMFCKPCSTWVPRLLLLLMHVDIKCVSSAFQCTFQAFRLRLMLHPWSLSLCSILRAWAEPLLDSPALHCVDGHCRLCHPSSHKLSTKSPCQITCIFPINSVFLENPGQYNCIQYMVLDNDKKWLCC